MPYIWFSVHWLAEHSPKSGKYRLTKLGRLTGRDPEERDYSFEITLSNSKMNFNEKPNSTTPPRAVRKWLIFDSGCTGWQSMLQNLENIDLLNFVGWLEETLRKEQNLCWSYSF